MRTFLHDIGIHSENVWILSNNYTQRCVVKVAYMASHLQFIRTWKSAYHFIRFPHSLMDLDSSTGKPLTLRSRLHLVSHSRVHAVISPFGINWILLLLQHFYFSLKLFLFYEVTHSSCFIAGMLLTPPHQCTKIVTKCLLLLTLNLSPQVKAGFGPVLISTPSSDHRSSWWTGSAHTSLT